MTQIKQTIETQDADTAPNVIAYRVGELEKTVVAGFKEHNDKLDTLINNFATKEELAQVQRQLANWVWYFRALFVAVCTALGTAVFSIVFTKK